MKKNVMNDLSVVFLEKRERRNVQVYVDIPAVRLTLNRTIQHPKNDPSPDIKWGTSAQTKFGKPLGLSTYNF